MNNFTNETVTIDNLPKYEQVSLKPIHKKQFAIIVINIFLVFLVIAIGLVTLNHFQGENFNNTFWLVIGIVVPVFFVLLLTLFYFSFQKRGFAFREHDAIYKSGIINQTTTIIPFKRIQHVALHQGLFSRFFGLASLELFTAGGSSTDLHISGLLLEDAQRYKIWIIEKIDLLIEEDFKAIATTVIEEKLVQNKSFEESKPSAHED